LFATNFNLIEEALMVLRIVKNIFLGVLSFILITPMVSLADTTLPPKHKKHHLHHPATTKVTVVRKKSITHSKHAHHKITQHVATLTKHHKHQLHKKRLTTVQHKKHHSHSLHSHVTHHRLHHHHRTLSAVQPLYAAPANDNYLDATGYTHTSMRYLNQVLQSLRYTHYKYGGNDFDVRRGVYALDCSHYVDHLIAASTPKAYDSVKRYSRTPSPVTNDYYSFFHNIPYEQIAYNWYRVKQTQNLRPGDIIVYRYYHTYHTGSGHMMIVAGLPKRDTHYTNIYRVLVSDSAYSGHSNDSRGPHHSGVGIGTLLLKVDPHTGIAYQYAWKEGAHWQGSNIAMGRPMK
jgi:hypothetical protein